MSTGKIPKVLLFSYGTLQDKKVQVSTFGRELTGRKDVLSGYIQTNIPILDQKIAAQSGESYYANASPTSNPRDAVSGTVFEITKQELAKADRYEEPAEYRRILVTLKSGEQAWVYVHA